MRALRLGWRTKMIVGTAHTSMIFVGKNHMPAPLLRSRGQAIVESRLGAVLAFGRIFAAVSDLIRGGCVFAWVATQ